MATESYLLLGALCISFREALRWFLRQDFESYFHLVYIDIMLQTLGIFFLGKALFFALQGIW